MSNEMRSLIIVTLSIFILSRYAFPDVVYIKGGGKVEGIITEEADDRITVDLGFGTMSVKRDDIDYIERATPQELEQLKKKKFEYEVDRGEWAPVGYQDIRLIYREAKENKAMLQEARRKSDAIKTEISQKHKRATELLKMLDKKGQELKSAEAAMNVKKYNAIIAAMNSLSVHINEVNTKLSGLYEQERDLNTILAQLANSYRSGFYRFKDELEKRKGEIAEEDVTQEEMYFCEIMNAKASDMESDFKKDIALYTPEGGRIIVNTQLEGSVSAHLVLDTGASSVVISPEIASRLGIEYDELQTVIKVTVADGAVVEAKPIILKSVKVGDAEVKNVEAAILRGSGHGGVDGLLGMSFLSHFVIKVDSTNNQLILERVL